MSEALFLDPDQAINTYRTNIGALVPNWLMRREDLSDGAKLLYARLQQYQGEDGDIKPKISTLAAELGKSERVVQNLIAELKEVKLIRVLDRRSLCTSNMYEILAHPWWQEAFVCYLVKRPELATVRPDLTKKVTSGTSRRILREAHEESDVSPHEESFVSVKRISSEENQRRESPSGQPQERPAGEVSGEAQAQEEGASRTEEQEAAGVAPAANGVEAVRARLLRIREQELVGGNKTNESVAKRLAGRGARGEHKQQRLKRQRDEALDEGLDLPETEKSVYGPLFRVWKAEFVQAFPEVLQASRWGQREWGQLKHLVDRYPPDQVEDLLRFTIRNWKAIRQKLFKGVGSAAPTIGFVLRFHDSLAPDAAVWLKHRLVLEEYANFDADPEVERPTELLEMYLEARKELKALGL